MKGSNLSPGLRRKAMRRGSYHRSLDLSHALKVLDQTIQRSAEFLLRLSIVAPQLARMHNQISGPIRSCRRAVQLLAAAYLG